MTSLPRHCGTMFAFQEHVRIPETCSHSRNRFTSHNSWEQNHQRKQYTIYTIYTKYTRIPKLQKLQALQNMNYEIYIKYKNNSLHVSFFFFFRKYTTFRKYFCVFGLFCTIIVILNIGFGFVVFDSLWEHRLNVCFTIFQKMHKKKTRTDHCFEVFAVLGS